ncbi:DUF3618 domain-containing protein [Streptomyces sp. NPDC102451]|uniref:DUF3618 domain-containing protein n=1 Tax=Streptomyces sp. NPDC102451 TaxID=3366177 RepID=UPI00380410B0
MKEESRTNIGTPDPSAPEELQEQVERTRDALGQTVEALAAEADVKTRAKEKAAAAGEQASEKAALAADQLRGKAEQATQLVRDKTPDPLLERAGRAASFARANRSPLLVGGALVAAFLLVRRGRGRR